MSKKSISAYEVALFIMTLARIKKEALLVAAVSEAGACVRNILRGRLRGKKAVAAAAEKMMEKIIKCPFCEVTNSDLETLKIIREFIVRNYS